MIEIHPFRGIRFNSKEVRLKDAIVRLEFVKRDFFKHWRGIGKHSILRFYNPERKKGAREDIKRLLDLGILIQDKKPAIYIYHQIFPLNGRLVKRRTFIAVMRLIEFEKGKILPHEEIFPGGKMFHLNLMKYFSYNIEQVLSLYSDPEGEIDGILGMFSTSAPIMAFRDSFGTDHFVWRVEDRDAIRDLQEIMLQKSVVIADGHHRYEASLAYRDMMKDKNPDPTAAPNFRQMAFTNVYDPGLVILPTHRLIRGVSAEAIDSFICKAEEFFDIEPVDREKLFLLPSCKEPHVFGVYMRDGKGYTLKLRNEDEITNMTVDHSSKEYKKLDVVILHSFILPKYLGIKGNDIRHIGYIRETEKALDAVDSGNADIAFLLSPTPPWIVKKIAEEGEKMPQKSTDFYPKLTAGMLLFDISPKNTLQTV